MLSRSSVIRDKVEVAGIEFHRSRLSVPSSSGELAVALVVWLE